MELKRSQPFFVIKPQMPRCKAQSDFQMRKERGHLSFFLSAKMHSQYKCKGVESLLPFVSPAHLPHQVDFPVHFFCVQCLENDWNIKFLMRAEGDVHSNCLSILRALWDIRLSSFISPVTCSGGAVQLRQRSSPLRVAVSPKRRGSFTLMGGAKNSQVTVPVYVEWALIVLSKF